MFDAPNTIRNPHSLLSWISTREPYHYIERLSDSSIPNLVSISSIGDGNCFFHCLANAYFIPYRQSNTQIPIVQKLRYELSEHLEKPYPKQPAKRYYDMINYGELPELSKTFKQCSLEYMKRELHSNHAVDNIYNHFISEIFQIDIYLYDTVKQQKIITGDEDIRIQQRPFIILMYKPGHYELGGLQTDSGIITYFAHDHPIRSYF